MSPLVASARHAISAGSIAAAPTTTNNTHQHPPSEVNDRVKWTRPLPVQAGSSNILLTYNYLLVAYTTSLLLQQPKQQSQPNTRSPLPPYAISTVAASCPPVLPSIACHSTLTASTPAALLCSSCCNEAGLVELGCLKSQQVDVGGRDVGQACSGQVVPHHHVVWQALAANVHRHGGQGVAGEREGLACRGNTITHRPAQAYHHVTFKHARGAVRIMHSSLDQLASKQGAVRVLNTVVPAGTTRHACWQQGELTALQTSQHGNASNAATSAPESASTRGLFVFFSRCTMSSALP